MSKLSHRPGRRDRKTREPLRPKHHMRRLIALVEARSSAATALEAAKSDAVSAEKAAELFDQYQAAQQQLAGYTSRGHGRQRFEPQHNRQAMRSKYRPHQGMREMERRRVGGFAKARYWADRDARVAAIGAIAHG